VGDSSLRFDFTHHEPLTPAQCAEIEAFVNQQIMENYPVTISQLPIEDAKKSGAMALFGEKYGDVVRVVQIGPQSRELCGGTHVSRSGDIGPFVFAGEGSISSGIRRVEALAGAAAYKRILSDRERLHALATIMRTTDGELLDKVASLVQRIESLEKAHARFEQQASSQLAAKLANEAWDGPGGVKVIGSLVPSKSPKELRELADELRNRLGTSCVGLVSEVDEKAVFLVAVSEEASKSFHAGRIVEQLAAIAGCRGGGKPTLAQAGGGDRHAIPAIISRFKELTSSPL
jgi:alanyl-tRNA synthetase